MLKKLTKDRRVDPGTKWSPIFGRYSFLHPDSEGHVIHVGDEVVVSRKNDERSQFGMCPLYSSNVPDGCIANSRVDWEGLHTLPK
jgi:hypothetical protein